MIPTHGDGMSDFGEAVADAATGGIAARAMEPDHGESARSAHEAKGVHCLNCDADLVGSHCHQCGQRGDIHRTLSAFFHDLMHGVLHFEGKLWRTLPSLAWRPGVLTREYIDGKRAKYISPIALFLFVVFLTYAAFSALGSGADIGFEADPDTAQEMREAYAALGVELADVQSDLIEARTDETPTTELEERVADIETQRDAVGVAMQLAGARKNASDDDMPNLQTAGPIDEDAVRNAWEKAKRNPQLLIYKAQTNAYKFAWLLIPLSVPFVWLMFPFSRRLRMYDHTVFVTYSIAFMLLLVLIASIAGYFDIIAMAALLPLYAPFHLYRQLRGTYGLNRFGAIWRTLVLGTFCWVVITVFAIGLTVMVAS